MDNTNMKSRYLEGIIRVVTPVHVASQGDSKTTDAEGRNKNVIYTTKMPAFTACGKAQLPYFPGNDLRGRMRRKAAEMVLEQVQPVPLALYHALTCGANNAAPESGAKSIKKLIESRDDLYLGLFGGGPRLHRSGMRVRNMVPIIPGVFDLGLVPEEYRDVMEGAFAEPSSEKSKSVSGFPYILSRHDFLRNDDALKGQDLNASSKVKRYAAAVAAWEGKLLEAKASEAENDDENDKKLGLSNMFTVEAIATGVPMYLRIDFDDYLSDAQVNFAAHCLVSVLNGPVGGWVRAGFGLVKIDKLNLCSAFRDPINALACNVPGENDVSGELPGNIEFDDALAEYTLEKLNSLLIAVGDKVDDETGLLIPAEKKVKKSKGKAAETEVE